MGSSRGKSGDETHSKLRHLERDLDKLRGKFERHAASTLKGLYWFDDARKKWVDFSISDIDEMSAIHPPDRSAVINSLTTDCKRGGQLLLVVPGLDLDDQKPEWWTGKWSPDLYRWAHYIWDYCNTPERQYLLRPHGNVVRVDNFAEVCCSVFDHLETHLPSGDDSASVSPEDCQFESNWLTPKFCATHWINVQTEAPFTKASTIRNRWQEAGGCRYLTTRQLKAIRDVHPDGRIVSLRAEWLEIIHQYQRIHDVTITCRRDSA